MNDKSDFDWEDQRQKLCKMKDLIVPRLDENRKETIDFMVKKCAEGMKRVFSENQDETLAKYAHSIAVMLNAYSGLDVIDLAPTLTTSFQVYTLTAAWLIGEYEPGETPEPVEKDEDPGPNTGQYL